MRGPRDKRDDDEEVTIDKGSRWAQQHQDELKDEFTYVDAADLTSDDRDWAQETYEAASQDNAEDQN